MTPVMCEWPLKRYDLTMHCSNICEGNTFLEYRANWVYQTYERSARNPIICKTFQNQDANANVNFQLFPEKWKTSYEHMAKDEVDDTCEMWVNEVTSDLGFRWEEWSVVSSWTTWWSTSRWMIHQCSAVFQVHDSLQGCWEEAWMTLMMAI